MSAVLGPPLDNPLPLGTIVKPWGKIIAVGWVGERYYWLIDKNGSISMMPADVVERDMSLGIKT